MPTFIYEYDQQKSEGVYSTYPRLGILFVPSVLSNQKISAWPNLCYTYRRSLESTYLMHSGYRLKHLTMTPI